MYFIVVFKLRLDKIGVLSLMCSRSNACFGHIPCSIVVILSIKREYINIIHNHIFAFTVKSYRTLCRIKTPLSHVD